MKVVSSTNFSSLTDWWPDVQLLVQGEEQRGKDAALGVPVLMVRVSEVFFPSCTCCHRRSVIHRQMESDTLSWGSLRSGRMMKSTCLWTAVGSGEVQLLQGEVEGHVDSIVYRPVGSAGKLHRVQKWVCEGLEVSMSMSMSILFIL